MVDPARAPMDAHDIRIFCALAITGPPDPIESPRPVRVGRLARNLGLDEKTVRLRLRRLEREGFIKYYQAAPNLSLLGMTCELTCRFDAVNVATKLRALDFARGLPGLVEALDFLGTTLVVTIAGPTYEAALGAQRSIAHRFEMDRFEVGQRTLEPAEETLAAVDWRIVRRLRHDARAPLTDVAHALGLTARMVRYRFARLTDSGAIAIRPMIDARRMLGALMYRLVVTPTSGGADDLVRPLTVRLGRTVWAVRRSLSGPLLLDMFATGLSDPEDSIVRALEVPGVQACSALVLKEILEPPPGSWLDQKIDELAKG